jgi:hypothetical protein
VALAVLIAACGASSSKSPPATSNASAPPTATTQTTTQPRTASYPQTTSHTSTSGASNVRLPATFTIEPGGKLQPPIVTGPAGVLIGLTVISGDGRSHRVTVGHRTLVVPAGGRAYAALRGLHDGPHPVFVDGASRGSLVVGGQVGP